MDDEKKISQVTSPIVPATEENIKRGATLLGRGEVCAFPTETVYGLGANAFSEMAVRKIYEMKGRPTSNPLIVHIPHLDAAISLVTAVPDLAYELAATFWPGPLTLVLSRGPKIPDIVSAGLPTIALRAPAHPVAQQLLEFCELPICAPSANRSEGLSPTTAAHVHQSLPYLPLILDGGPCRFGIESTVIDLTKTPPRLLRPGALPLVDLLQIVPDLIIPVPFDALPAEIPRSSPGMMARHYAPRARLILCKSIDQANFEQFDAPYGLITLQPDQQLQNLQWFVETLPDDPVAYAADLYAALHRLDDLGVRTIFVESPPQTRAWLAINDRLFRAAASK